jgi:hypothetical protein
MLFTAWQHVRNLCCMLGNPLIAQVDSALPGAAVTAGTSNR